jgi:hypothetical protein
MGVEVCRWGFPENEVVWEVFDLAPSGVEVSAARDPTQ